ELAQRTAGERLTPTTRAMIHTVEAWAQAALGQSAECRRTLGLAEREFADARPQDDPDWIGFFDSADLHGMQALVYRTLADTDPSAVRPAQEHAQKAMELRAQGHQRSQTFDLISLASAYLLDGQPDAGAQYARLAIRSTREVSSLRTWDRLGEMQKLTGRYKDVAEVKSLHEEIADSGGLSGPTTA
ncbi:MAG: hypothetical protein HOV68_28075, partial [Streptomycetaceae bacterium]|nr:hypothetical protein [Streptomycetaceae bacterium]